MLSGSDEIQGGYNDMLNGSDGNDYLPRGDGSDTIDVGPGNDETSRR